MNAKRAVEISKRLSYVLRHAPESIGVALDETGWVNVETLLDALGRHGHKLTRDELREVVETSDKKRFALSEDGSQIRAQQGHSVEVDLNYTATVPPETLYHGTVAKFLDSIRAEGLKKGERTHVHLSPDLATATKVGSRRGKPVILRVRALEMHAAGHAFFHTPNDVWLTDRVPPEFIESDEPEAPNSMFGIPS